MNNCICQKAIGFVSEACEVHGYNARWTKMTNNEVVIGKVATNEDAPPTRSEFSELQSQVSSLQNDFKQHHNYATTVLELTTKLYDDTTGSIPHLFRKLTALEQASQQEWTLSTTGNVITFPSPPEANEVCQEFLDKANKAYDKALRGLGEAVSKLEYGDWAPEPPCESEVSSKLNCWKCKIRIPATIDGWAVCHSCAHDTCESEATDKVDFSRLLEQLQFLSELEWIDTVGRKQRIKYADIRMNYDEIQAVIALLRTHQGGK